MRTGGRLAVLGGVARALEVVEVGRDHGMAGETPLRVLQRREPVEQQVQDRRGPAHPDVAHLAVELGAEPRRAHQPEEGAAGVGARHHAARRDLFAVGQHDSGGGLVFHHDTLDLGFRADHRPVGARRRGQRSRQSCSPRPQNDDIVATPVRTGTQTVPHPTKELTEAGTPGDGAGSISPDDPPTATGGPAGHPPPTAPGPQQIHEGGDAGGRRRRPFSEAAGAPPVASPGPRKTPAAATRTTGLRRCSGACRRLAG